jgi:transketolase
VEQAASLRLVPNLDVWRPCDAAETLAAWTAAVERRTGPSALLLSRQALPAQRRNPAALDGIARGGYVLAEAEGGAPRAVIVATGSEVAIALEARAALAREGVPVRVVSMPCTAAFDRAGAEWCEAVMPRGVPRVAVEAGATDGWWRYVGTAGKVVGIDRFGECGAAPELFRRHGITADAVAEAVRTVVREP